MIFREYITKCPRTEQNGKLEIISSRFSEDGFFDLMKKIQQKGKEESQNNGTQQQPTFPVKTLVLKYIDFGTKDQQSFSLADVINSAGKILRKYSVDLSNDKCGEYLLEMPEGQRNIFNALLSALFCKETTLEKLDLTYNRINDDGAYVLQQMLKYKKEKFVDISVSESSEPCEYHKIDPKVCVHLDATRFQLAKLCYMNALLLSEKDRMRKVMRGIAQQNEERMKTRRIESRWQR